MKAIKTLAASAALACAGLAASADVTLGNYGTWSAYYDGTHNLCGAVGATGSIGMSITFTYRAGMEFQLFFGDDQSFAGQKGINLRVQVDNRRPIMLVNGEGFKGSLFYRMPPGDEGTRFLRSVVNGNRLSVLDADGSRLFYVDLSGSSRAFQDFAWCVNQL